MAIIPISSTVGTVVTAGSLNTLPDRCAGALVEFIEDAIHLLQVLDLLFNTGLFLFNEGSPKACLARILSMALQQRLCFSDGESRCLCQLNELQRDQGLSVEIAAASNPLLMLYQSLFFIVSNGRSG